MDDRQLLKNFLRNLSGLPELREQDDDPFGGGEEEEEAEGEDEAGEDEAGEDEAGDDEAGGEEAKKDEKIEPDPEAGTDDSLDGELYAIFVDIESKSMKESSTGGRYSLSYHLLSEQDSAGTLDLDRFAEETARIFRNVEAFLDIDEIILKKAEQFVTDKHGADKAEQLLNILKNRYNIVRKEEAEKAQLDIDKSVPIAVGAGSGPA